MPPVFLPIDQIEKKKKINIFSILHRCSTVAKKKIILCRGHKSTNSRILNCRSNL